MTDLLYAGQIVEGSITQCQSRELSLDAYFTFASFLVTKLPPAGGAVALPITIVFLDGQSDIANPPRGCFVRAKVDSGNPFARSPFATANDPIMLTDIEFVHRDSLKVVGRIPSAPKFAT
jgi:hypothetical protein